MSGFFDKLKQGVSDTADKAKTAVEVQRLKGQISSKQKEINGKFFEIGKLTYQAVKEGDFSAVQSQIEGFCGEVTAFQAEIDQIQDKIKELEQEGEPGAVVEASPAAAPAAPSSRACTCGTEVPVDAKFCPECGNRF